MTSFSPPWQPAFGATIDGDGVRFGVWAPNAADGVNVVLGDGDAMRDVPMTTLGDGCYEVRVPGIGAGARYGFRLDGGDPRPDPYSRSQPDGVHGLSEVIDPAFAWTDDGWGGLSADGLVIYELHVGTMTPEGTFAALIGELEELARLA
jgi:maltooligosyltrehalose trehalohydrolase